MKLNSFLILVCTSLLIPTIVCAEDRPKSLNFCHSDQDEPPWIAKSGDGVNQQMMKLLEKELKVTIQLSPMAWKRCLSELQAGNMHGAFPSSFKADRLPMGVYPMTGDKPDQTRRVHITSYSLYVVKGSTATWDGSAFKNVNGAIGIQTGYSIGDFLKKNNVSVDDANKSSLDILKKVQLGRLGGAALQTNQGDAILKANADLNGKIQKITVPLEEKAYFLMLSHQLVKSNPKFSQEIGEKMKTVRDSSAIKKAIEQASK
jgi:polar amino acid transport system substrate-binding protein